MMTVFHQHQRSLPPWHHQPTGNNNNDDDAIDHAPDLPMMMISMNARERHEWLVYVPRMMKKNES
jgi:hypothetical protein